MSSVKELVLKVFSLEEGLRLSEIHRQLVSKQALRSSVQATRKALQGLVKEGVLQKQGSHYFIAMSWVMKEKAFLDQVLLLKTRKKLVGIDRSADYNEFFFDNLFELDNFWNTLLLQLAREEKPKDWIAWDNFLWFFIINIGFETALVNELHKLGFKRWVGARSRIGINEWAFGIYRALGVEIVALDEKNVSDGTDINIIGNSVVEVSFDPRVYSKIKAIFTRYRRLEEIPLSLVAELSTMKGKHSLKLFRSSVIAERLRKEFFELARKKSV